MCSNDLASAVPPEKGAIKLVVDNMPADTVSWVVLIKAQSTDPSLATFFTGSQRN